MVGLFCFVYFIQAKWNVWIWSEMGINTTVWADLEHYHLGWALSPLLKALIFPSLKTNKQTNSRLSFLWMCLVTISQLVKLIFFSFGDKPWWSGSSPLFAHLPVVWCVSKIEQTEQSWGILNSPEVIWGLFAFCFMGIVFYFLSSDICTSRNLVHSQTFTIPGIIISCSKYKCISEVHWYYPLPLTQRNHDGIVSF